MNNTAASALSVTAKRWESAPWEPSEFVVYSVRVERETEKAVLLVDAASTRRRSCWLPKRAFKGDKDGVLSAWANGKLAEAGFTDVDVISLA